MRNFQQKKRWRNIVESWPVLVLLTILLLFFAWGIIGLFRRMEITRENKKIAEIKLTELTQKKETFSTDVAKMSTQAGIEDSIRERYPVVKEGEGLIVVVDDKNAPATANTESKSFWSKLLFWR